MGWFGKLTFGSMGLLMGGPLGAIAGAALGHHLVDKREDYHTHAGPNAGPRLIHTEQSQAAYFISMFSILGKMAKIDGAVTRAEIAVVEHFIANLNMTEREKQFAKQVFNEAKSSQYSIDDFATEFYRISGGQPTVLVSFLDLLFRIAAADKTLHPDEEGALKRVKTIFHINDGQFNNMRATYFGDVDRSYKVLNCTAESSDQEIKANYKKLVKDFHPDTIVSKGLPEAFTDFAAKRFREIQDAYERIRQERNF
ncbi:MAG: TerB family tellurite resistance protein [Thermodesulfobacteriota bacterium]|nr:TerB family tellurite resistance protein [Thermodesulfobacteriota bacterium]